VGTGEHDCGPARRIRGVDLIVERRMKRRLVTVIDTLGMDAARRAKWLRDSRTHDLPCFAIAFAVAAREARTRLDARGRSVPAAALKQQFDAWREVQTTLAGEGFAGVVIDPGPIELVPPQFVDAPARAQQQKEQPVTLRFGLQIPASRGPADRPKMGARLRDIAQAAEEVGFESIWVMDHFRQIPIVGPEWHDMLDSYSALSYIAAATRRVKLGSMVTGVTYRNAAHLARSSRRSTCSRAGRAICVLARRGSNKSTSRMDGPFPSVRALRIARRRVAVVAIAVGTRRALVRRETHPRTGGDVLSRPLQARIPILVGGSVNGAR